MATLEALRVGGRHAEIAALANLLAEQGALAPHTGRPFTEAMLLGIGGGYFVFEFTGCPKVLVIGARHAWHQPDVFLRGICARIGAPVVVRETTSAKVAAGHLAAALGEGRQGLAWVDLAGLPYTFVASEWERCWLHVVGVLGVDTSSDTVLVDDRGPVPWHVDSTAFRQARAAIRSNKHRLLVDAPPAVPDLVAAIRAGLRAGLDGLLNAPIENFGLPAIEKWVDLVANPKDKKGWPTVFRPGPDLLRALTATFHAVEANGTGGGALRPTFATFLDEAADVLGVPSLGDVADRYRRLGAAWTELADAALPDAVAPLGETRRLLREKERLTLERGAAAFDELRTVNERLRAIEGDAAEAFPLTDADAMDMLVSLRARLLEIAVEERAAAGMLQATLGETV